MRLLIRESPNMVRGEAPKEVPVHRREVWDAIHRDPPPDEGTGVVVKSDEPLTGGGAAAPAQ